VGCPQKAFQPHLSLGDEQGYMGLDTWIRKSGKVKKFYVSLLMPVTNDSKMIARMWTGNDHDSEISAPAIIDAEWLESWQWAGCLATYSMDDLSRYKRYCQICHNNATLLPSYYQEAKDAIPLPQEV
jgi:hypothetical protein